MRVWGRIEGRQQTDSDPLGAPSYVYGFVEVPPGSNVDLIRQGENVKAIFVSDTLYTATFKLGQKEEPFTLSHADYTLCVRRENDGVILPDLQQRLAREGWDKGPDLEGVFK